MKPWRLWLIGILVLTGCHAALSATPEPVLPPVRADADVIAVEGIIEPARWVTLRAGDSSLVVEVLVAEGDTVAAGDVLLRLDEVDARLTIRQIETALAEAQAQLTLVKAGARPEQIATIEAQLAAATAIVSQRMALLDVHRAGGTEADIADAQVAIATAGFAYDQANERHDDTMECFDAPRPDGNKERICPALGTYEEMARAQMEAAQSALIAAQAQLAAIRGPAEASLAEAQAGVQIALAQRDAVQAQLDLARAGAGVEAIAVAETAVRQAEAALASAHALLESRTFDAPFAATVTDSPLHPGDVTTPGSALLTLATLDALHIRTTNLTELDIAQVTEGQSVLVTFDALPDQSFIGYVARIDRQGEDYLGDVVYPVFIKLDAMPVWAKWGMTANCEVRMANDEVPNDPNTRTPEPPNTIFAEALIEPERWSELRFTTAGEVVEVLVRPGVFVQAGDMIARLDATYVKATIQEAETVLATARAQLAWAQAGPNPEAITAAKAQVTAAEGEVTRVIALRDQLTVKSRDAQMAAVRAQMAAAQAEKRQLEAQWQWAQDSDDHERAGALRAQITVVEQRIAAAQTHLTVIPRVFAAQGRAAEAGVGIAEAQRDVAMAQLTLAQTSPRAEEVAVAEAAVQQAEAALATAEAALADLELRAPLDGTVTQVTVEVGDKVTEGRPVAVLATLDHLQLRTTDLLETDIVYVAEGQSVLVKVDALPDQSFHGQVAHIKPQSALFRGDVTYPMITTSTETPPTLFWGMKAVVEINVR